MFFNALRATLPNSVIRWNQVLKSNSRLWIEKEFMAVDRAIQVRGSRNLDKLKAVANRLEVDVPNMKKSISMNNPRVIKLIEACAIKLKEKANERN
mmetsp:Transcript_15653/g.20069  ORF Transcript_15653/g.20069 Transcript_15653/m.20069 type:complete len:96 (-) Transcript_15653:493-780(-)